MEKWRNCERYRRFRLMMSEAVEKPGNLSCHFAIFTRHCLDFRVRF